MLLSGDENPAKLLLARILAGADVEAASSDDAVCTFEVVSVQAPRGRFDIEMHLHFLTLVGQSQEFKVSLHACGLYAETALSGQVLTLPGCMQCGAASIVMCLAVRLWAQPQPVTSGEMGNGDGRRMSGNTGSTSFAYAATQLNINCN